MTLENQVTSLEISKRLKNLNVKQKSLFYWEEAVTKSEGMEYAGVIFGENKANQYSTGVYSAFTVAELGEILSRRYERNAISAESSEVPICLGDEWVWYRDGEYILSDSNEANARGKMLIYLLENNLLKDGDK